MLFDRGSGDQMQVMKQLQLIYLLSWGLGFKPSEMSQILSVLGRVNILFENKLECSGRLGKELRWSSVAGCTLTFEFNPQQVNIFYLKDLSSQIQALERLRQEELDSKAKLSYLASSRAAKL